VTNNANYVLIIQNQCLLPKTTVSFVTLRRLKNPTFVTKKMIQMKVRKKPFLSGSARKVRVWGGVEGYFHEKSIRKSVKSWQNLFFSLEKTEKF